MISNCYILLIRKIKNNFSSFDVFFDGNFEHFHSLNIQIIVIALHTSCKNQNEEETLFLKTFYLGPTVIYSL